MLMSIITSNAYVPGKLDLLFRISHFLILRVGERSLFIIHYSLLASAKWQFRRQVLEETGADAKQFAWPYSIAYFDRITAFKAL